MAGGFLSEFSVFKGLVWYSFCVRVWFGFAFGGGCVVCGGWLIWLVVLFGCFG